MCVRIIDRLRSISLIDRLIPSGSLINRTVKSGLWLSVENASDRVLQLLKAIILARLLTPTEFGILGIAFIAINAVRALTRVGLNEALIQNKSENIDDYLDTAWLMEIGRAVITFVVAAAVAIPVARGFGEPAAGPLIIAIAATSIVFALRNPGIVYFRKDLQFHKRFIFNMSGSITNFTVAVGMALVFRSVWVFFAGILAGRLMSLFVSYIIHDYRPSIHFDWKKASEILNFSKWIFLSSILLFLIHELDDSVVGFVVGTTALGLYQMAYRFSNAPATEVTHVISEAVFPAFSKVQTETAKLRRAFFQTFRLTTAIAFPMSAGIIAVAPVFVPAVFGPDWIPMIPVMQILAVWGAIRAMGSNAGPLFKAIGRPDYETKVMFIKIAIIALFIYPATQRFGIIGAAYVIVGNALIINPIVEYIALKEVKGSIHDLIWLLIYPIFNSCLMALIVIGLERIISGIPLIVELGLLIMVGIVCYIALVWLTTQFFGYKIDTTWRMIRNNFS